MSTQDSEKLRLALAAIASVCLIYCGMAVGLNRLAVWAEVERGVYPYKREDWLRYLLPTFFQEHDGKNIMIAGPSAARETFLLGPIIEEFPSTHVFQGALSLGTLDDLIVSLDYIEQAYGAETLPDVLVLGLTPRFVANVPADRPFLPAIDRYSSHFSISDGHEGPVLEPKNAWARAISWLNFHLVKQTNRYQTAVMAITLEAIQSGRKHCQDSGAFCVPGWPGRLGDWILSWPNPPRFLPIALVARLGLDETLANELSPLKYRHFEPRTAETLNAWLTDPESFWYEVFEWEPTASADLTLRKFRRLFRFTSSRNIQVVAINMPENAVCRVIYEPERYDAYRNLIAQSLANIPYFDMRSFLPQDEFMDVVHPTFKGAEHATERLIEMLKENQSADTLGPTLGDTS